MSEQVNVQISCVVVLHYLDSIGFFFDTDYTDYTGAQGFLTDEDFFKALS